MGPLDTWESKLHHRAVLRIKQRKGDVCYPQLCKGEAGKRSSFAWRRYTRRVFKTNRGWNYSFQCFIFCLNSTSKETIPPGRPLRVAVQQKPHFLNYTIRSEVHTTHTHKTGHDCTEQSGRLSQRRMKRLPQEQRRATALKTKCCGDDKSTLKPSFTGLRSIQESVSSPRQSVKWVKSIAD